MKFRSPITEGALARWLLVGTALAYIGLILLLPLTAVFVEAFRQGIGAWFDSMHLQQFLFG